MKTENTPITADAENLEERTENPEVVNTSITDDGNPKERTVNTSITDDGGKPKGVTAQSRWVFGLLVIAALAAVMYGVLPSRNKTAENPLSSGDMEQLKREAEQNERDDRKVDGLKDQSPSAGENEGASIGQHFLNYTQGTPKTPPTGQSSAQPDNAGRDEEAINHILRGKPSTQNTPQSAQSQDSNTGNMPPMFVYSRSFGGAKYVEPPKVVSQTTPVSSPEKAANEAAATSGNLPNDETAAPAQESENRTKLIYTGIAPVTVHEGEMLEAVLVNRLLVDTEPSPVICRLSRDLFDANGRYVVFPVNSRVIGTSQAVSYNGASRLFISFHRIILPNGLSVDLPQNQRMMKALDATGALGIVSNVDRHWFMQFGTAVFLGVIDGIAGYAQRNQQMTTADGAVISRTLENFDNVLDRVMSQYSSIVPTIRVDQGKTLRIYISGDMVVSPYAKISERSYRAVH